MNPALWIAKTGLDAQQTRMAVVSNNLANVNTTGFKKGRAAFEDLLYQTRTAPGSAVTQDSVAPTGMTLGTGVRVVATGESDPLLAVQAFLAGRTRSASEGCNHDDSDHDGHDEAGHSCGCHS